MSDPAAAAAAAAQAVSEHTAAVEASAEEAIEHAEQRAEAAQVAAGQLADAAMATEIGRRIANHETRVEQWHRQHDEIHLTLQSRLGAMETSLQEIRDQLTTPPTVTVTQVSPEPQTEAISSTPASSPEVTVTTVQPSASEPAGQNENTPVETPPRKGRYRLI